MVKVIFGKLLHRAEVAIRLVISAFDSAQTRLVVVKKLEQFTVPLLESCAEFLGIVLANQKGYKIFTKPALAERIYLGLRALLPASCKECGEIYVTDHRPQDPHLFSCFALNFDTVLGLILLLHFFLNFKKTEFAAATLIC